MLEWLAMLDVMSGSGGGVWTLVFSMANRPLAAPVLLNAQWLIHQYGCSYLEQYKHRAVCTSSFPLSEQMKGFLMLQLKQPGKIISKYAS